MSGKGWAPFVNSGPLFPAVRACPGVRESEAWERAYHLCALPSDFKSFGRDPFGDQVSASPALKCPFSRVVPIELQRFLDSGIYLV